MSALDRLSEAFAEFMTPDESGEPLLLESDVRHAVEAAGIPAQLAPELLRLMQPENGAVTFEKFSKACGDVIGADAPSDEDSEGGGFVVDDDDDEDYDDDDYSEDGGMTDTRDHIFDVLSRNGRITVTSLRKEAKRLKFDVSTSDLERMVQVASTRDEFASLWRQLQ